jgi:hypothetical protein
MMFPDSPTVTAAAAAITAAAKSKTRKRCGVIITSVPRRKERPVQPIAGFCAKAVERPRLRARCWSTAARCCCCCRCPRSRRPVVNRNRWCLQRTPRSADTARASLQPASYSRGQIILLFLGVSAVTCDCKSARDDRHSRATVQKPSCLPPPRDSRIGRQSPARPPTTLRLADDGVESANAYGRRSRPADCVMTLLDSETA